MRVLVTGSRTWDRADLIRAVLDDRLEEARWVGEQLVVVHGDCPRGADRIARQWAREHDYVTEEAHPARWGSQGKAAGMIRNQLMVDLGADLCLAFIRDGSRGATHCADLAEAAGIPTKRWLA